MSYYYECKKLNNGYVMVRDYNVKECYKKGEDLTICFNGQEMIIPNSELKNPIQLDKRKFQSKFNKNEMYSVYHFKWKSLKNIVENNPSLFSN